MVELQIYTTKETLVCKIQAEPNWTIEKLKHAIYKQTPKLIVSRQSLRNEKRGKDLGNKVLLSTILNNDNRLFVKDLGPQISWTAVFLAEYLGPLIVYSLFAIRPSIIYGEASNRLSTTASIAWICWSAHYAKRLLETIFIHRFSHGTMPLTNLFKNCSYYWGFAAFVAYHVNHPLFTPPSVIQCALGLVIFTFCELGNLSAHILLRNLRPVGTTVRKIPVPDGNPFNLLFNFVSCPNYLYEYGAWLGFTVLTSCIPSLIFAIAGMFQMSIWALGKHRNYRKEFVDYPKKRKAIIPFIL